MKTSTSNRHCGTKVVATLGPGCEGRVGELIDAGLSVARLNFSHGTHEDHRRRAEAVRRAAEERDVAVGILADIQGPKLRLALFPGGSRELQRGETYRLRSGTGVSEEGEILFDFEGLDQAVSEGDRVFLADGILELVVESVSGDGIRARVELGGTVRDRKGVHLPDSNFAFDLPTKKDLEDLELARELGVDFLGISYVSSAKEIARIRDLGLGAQIVAKIERMTALENQLEIIEASDGIMVARGDLGVEVPLARLPLVQKSLIQAAMKCGKFTIIATEMLESMITANRPTRAEVTDVANAVLDGTDAVMLSAETAVGANPVSAVRTMTEIAEAVEESQRYHDLPRVAFRDMEPTFSNATAMVAAEAAEALDLHHIVCFTESGNTVRLLSRYRPSASIIALTPSERTLRSMTVLAHVLPVLSERRDSLEEMLHEGQDLLMKRGLLQPGQEVVFVAGVPPGVSRSTNVMKLHRVGDAARLH